VIIVDDPHVAAVERLIELARERGFTFTPPGRKAHRGLSESRRNG
jgi:hypothetical protein